MFDQETLDRLNAGVSLPSADEEPATAEELAVIEFEAVDQKISSPFQEPLWTERCRNLGNCLRLAAGLVRLTKPELMKSVRKMVSDNDGGIEACEEIMPAFKNVTADCLSFADLLDAARARLLIACASIEFELGKELS